MARVTSFRQRDKTLRIDVKCTCAHDVTLVEIAHPGAQNHAVRTIDGHTPASPVASGRAAVLNALNEHRVVHDLPILDRSVQW